MKRLFFIAMLLFTAVSFAGNALVQTTGINLETYVASFSAVIATSVLLVDLAQTKLKLKGLGLQIFSWLISVVVCFAAYFLKFGLFDGTESILHVAIIGAAASLAANGLADTGLIRAVLGLFGINVKDDKRKA